MSPSEKVNAEDFARALRYYRRLRAAGHDHAGSAASVALYLALPHLELETRLAAAG